jgi:hypothetical protein
MARDDETLSTADIASQREEAERSPSRDPEHASVSDPDVQDERSRDDPGEGSVDERDDSARAVREPLFQPEETEQLRRRWETIQTGFVDEPRRAVEEADQLVADLMQRLAERFSQERGNLEGQWDRGEDISTEDLRVALQRYRSFFDRLLST